MKPETERIAQLARAYGVQCIGASRGVSSYKDQSVAMENLLAAIEHLVADRDTLAAGIGRGFGSRAFMLAINVAERLKPASEPAKPPAATVEPEYDLVVVNNERGSAWRYRPGHEAGEIASLSTSEPRWMPSQSTRSTWRDCPSRYRMFTSWAEAEKWIAGEAKPPAVPAVTATGEQKPAEPEPVKPPAMRVWYENGRYFVEFEGSVLSLGPKHKDPSAYAIYVPGPATGGPKSAEYAEPAKPSVLANKLEAMRDSVDVLRLAKDSSHPHRFLKIVVACEALARVVDELAKAKGAK